MIGGVNLDQGANTVQGGRLVLDLDTGRAVMDGGGPRAASRAAAASPATFTVPPAPRAPLNRLPRALPVCIVMQKLAS